MNHPSYLRITTWVVALLILFGAFTPLVVSATADGTTFLPTTLLMQGGTTTLTATSFTNTSGGSGSGQTVTNIQVQDQSGSQNNWNKYIEFTTPGSATYAGYRKYIVPTSVDVNSISGIQVTANFLGSVPADQTWTWKIYNWSTSTWLTLGTNAGGSWSAWKFLTFTVPSGTMSNYVKSDTREIRVQLVSNNTSDNADLDYESVILTTGGTSPTNTPVPPTNTPVPPTNTPPPGNTPTFTPVPPTATPIPPTATPAPGTCTHYVATTGNDNNNGSLATPWRTVQKAANTVSAGSTVCIRGGEYNEVVNVTVSGTSGAYTTFQSYPGETAILDGSGLTVPAGETALLKITTQSYLIIKGLHFRDYETTTLDRVPVGIRIYGTGHHIQLRDNKVYNIRHNRTSTRADGSGVDAHGIAVHGTSGSQSVNNIIIDNNELYSLKLGSSEALVLNGNVETWEVTNNIVRDSNNIGIDIIGWEDTAAGSPNDQARNGVIRGNHVYNIDTFGNPAYGNERSAGCVYVDGGKNVIIERNHLHNCNLGIEIASEHAGTATSFITVRNNLVYNNTQAGLAMGGYDTDRGSTENCMVVNNTFFNNRTQGDWGAELYVQYDTRNNTVKNNIFYATSAGIFIESWSPVMQGNVVNHNLYYTTGGSSTWQWQNVSYTSFAAYKTGTGNDANGLNSNPLFVNTTPSAPDLHLQSGSPAINAGQTISEAGTQDYYGDTRVQGAAIDIGSEEVQ